MRRWPRIVPFGAAAAAAAALTAAALASGVTGGEEAPQAPIPRVCWFSDYANAKLSNRCTYRSDEQRWYMEVDGDQRPADEQRLPVANLCLYFHGPRCPER